MGGTYLYGAKYRVGYLFLFLLRWSDRPIEDLDLIHSDESDINAFINKG